MITTQGNLVMIGLNTPTPTVYWNGIKVPGIVSIKVECEDEEHRVKLKVSDPLSFYDDLMAAGIIVRSAK